MSSPTVPTQFLCTACGAALHFSPTHAQLTCPHCGTLNHIPTTSNPSPALDYLAELTRLEGAAETEETLAVHCNQCGAETHFPPGQTAGRCPFSTSPIVATARSRKHVKPHAVLPFKVSEADAAQLFRDWLANLFIAPNDLTKLADRDALRPLYLPAWTYSCHTTTTFTGQRGENLLPAETYTVFRNGQPIQRKHESIKVSWTPITGQIPLAFTDILIPASPSLPDKDFYPLEPWDLSALTPYRDEYLAGYLAESYATPLAKAFSIAQQRMATPIEDAIRHFISGDHQRITTRSTHYADITFKHILLPVYLSSFRYRNKTYHLLINTQSGQIHGNSPQSLWKVLFLTFLLIAVIVTISVVASYL